jgi:hypothetical protein
MVSKNDLPSRLEDDPPWFHKESGEMSELSAVEVLLVQGRWPDPFLIASGNQET